MKRYKMKKHNLNNCWVLILVVFITNFTFGQELLTKQEAIEIALKNNFDIRFVKNNLQIAKNNADILNSGYLPTVSAAAGLTSSNKDFEGTLQDGTVRTAPENKTIRYNASVGVNYVLFDGFNRKYAFESLKKQYDISELQARFIIEQTLISVFQNYYTVARLTENVATLKEILYSSNDRLKRAQYSYEYGQNTRLDVLNAKVDVSNDSIAYLDKQQELSNAKRNLNVVLGRDLSKQMQVDTLVQYSLGFHLDEILSNALEHNASFEQTKKRVELNQFNEKISKSNWFPKISLNGNYAWDKSDNGVSAQFLNQTTKGLSGGVNVSWNIFNGGKTKTNVANAKILTQNQELVKQQEAENLKKEILNAWETYQTSLFVLEARKNNVLTSKLNFERTKERYELGQVNSINFRQAQINLMNAKLNLSGAKYALKLSELNLLRFEGKLIGYQGY